MQTIYKSYPNIRRDVYESLQRDPIPGTPLILDILPLANGWRICEELIPGETLRTILERGLLSLPSAVRFSLELCDIVEQLHARGIVHGDIKPDNIIIWEDRLYLIDFNASHFVQAGSGTDTVLLGTPGFAAPEQYGFGRSDTRADIYSIGALLNVMLTGKFPQYGVASGRISIVISRCTQVDPDNRYQTIAALRNALRNPVDERRWIPPGFRSGNPVYMVLSSLLYAVILLPFIVVIIRNHQVPGAYLLTIVPVLIIGWIFFFGGFGETPGLPPQIGRRFLRALLFLLLLILFYTALLLLLMQIIPR